MKSLLEELDHRLAALRAQKLERTLEVGGGVDFCSNDYLGLSRHPGLRDRIAAALRSGPVGAPASRLLGGTHACHQALEARLARFKGTEAALLLPSGYQANLALLTTLVGPQDRVLSDEQNHASLIDGMRLAGATKRIVPHLDLGAMEAALAEPHPSGRTFVVVESLFSMDGDRAPLAPLAEAADRSGAALIIDDAHATGLYGARGSGLAEQEGVARRAIAIVSTFGKALGLSGAFLAGPRIVIDYLVSRARPFIFSTAPSPLSIAAMEASLDLVEQEPERRAVVKARADRLRTHLTRAGLDTLRSDGPIVPVLLGSNERALAVARAVQRAGYDVRAVRPPSVAPGTARLRISVHADHTEAEIDGLAAALGSAARTEESR